MTTEELLKQQNELQKEGNLLLEKIGLIEFISKFAKPEIVGSMVSGLMVWPDIDLVLVVDQINDEDYWKIVKFIFYIKDIYHSMYIQDFRKSQNPNTPKGLYIGTKLSNDGKEWKIDLWIIPRQDEGKENMNEWIKEKLNDENRAIILNIKNELYKNIKYRKDFFSVDIYKAVIENGVKDVEGFREYLSKSNRSFD